MKKILLLTASFGDGHNAAAHSLRDALILAETDAQVDVVDLFELTYGSFNRLLKQGYQGLVKYAPSVWSQLFKVFDSPFLFRQQLRTMGRLRQALGALLESRRPDIVVSTYPVYGHLIAELFPANASRPFRFVTIVTDSTSVCSAWFLAPSELFIVANEQTAQVLLKAGIAFERVRALGFPVSPVFALADSGNDLSAESTEPPRLLYVINTGKARTGRALDRLLEISEIELTITAGRDPILRAELSQRFNNYGDRVRVLGWTSRMPQLLMNHHLLIGKAGGAMVQEAIAARCPMLVNQVIPGQEEGNARLIESLRVGAVAENPEEIPLLVECAFAHNRRLWKEWKTNLQKVSRPDSALRISQLLLQDSFCGSTAASAELKAPALQYS